jgi:hypothetical protein
LIWGRDQLGTGEMWNSNSVISWLLFRSGVSVETIHPPEGGRAPGWEAGISIAIQCTNPGSPHGLEHRVRPEGHYRNVPFASSKGPGLELAIGARPARQVSSERR